MPFKLFKHIFALIFALISFLFIIQPNAIAQYQTINCGTNRLVDSYLLQQGNPVGIGGASVQIHIRSVAGGQCMVPSDPTDPDSDPIVYAIPPITTQDDGSWTFQHNRFPINCYVESIDFSHPDYQSTSWNNMDTDANCNAGTTELAPTESGGFNCINPGDPNPDLRCLFVTSGGTYSDEQSCIVACDKFVCQGASCVSCHTAGLELDQCPYTNSDCNNECISVNPSPIIEETTKTFYKPNPCRIYTGARPDDYFEGIETVLGCIPTNSQLFIRWFINKAISIGGGLAFLIMIWGAFQVMTSSGNPEKLQEGKQIMVSAGAGLLFIIFSVFILQTLGVNILKIPGWS